MASRRSEQFSLSAQTIDNVSAICVETLTEAETDKKDIQRIRLSLEEIMGAWHEAMGNAPVYVSCGKKFGRMFLEIGVEGPQCNDWDGGALLFCNRLLAQAGLSLVYTYKNGRNCLTCNPPKKPGMGQMTQLVIAVSLAAVLGLSGRMLPQAGRTAVLAVTEPVFNMILGALRAVSSPLVFLAVCCGIVSIGDMAMVGKIGKKLIIGMLAGTLALGIVCAFLGSMVFPLALETGSMGFSGFSEAYRMILGIVPSDIVSPFLDGNALQIVFLGVCVGAALLIVGERVSFLQNIVMQANETVQFLMGGLSSLVPIFVFLSLFDLLLSELDSGFVSLFKVFLLAIPGCILLILFYLLYAAARLQISPALLIRKMLPTYLIALTTASSAAALATNLETCEKQLGIPKKVADFAVPLGQVIYKPGFVVGIFSIALCVAEYYGVAISPLWLITAVLAVWLLSMAVPPIPGGALSIFTVLFAQLYIPDGAIALAVAMNAILDFFMTSCGLSCLQVNVMLVSGSVGMLDKKTLYNNSEKGR